MPRTGPGRALARGEPGAARRPQDGGIPMSRGRATTDAGAAIAYLDGLSSYEQTGLLEHPTTERIARLAAALGNPQRSYPVIHLTGTNGKGSTTAMIASLLDPLRAAISTRPVAVK